MRHERLRASCAPVPVQEVTVLRVLLVGLCAFALITQAAAATKKIQSHPGTTKQTVAKERRPRTLKERLEWKLATAGRYRRTIRVLKTNRQLATSKERRVKSRRALRHAELRLAQLTKTIEALRTNLRAREARERAAHSPEDAICEVFGPYCREAVAVAWCESRLQPSARNGQYLGLFQMGTRARQLYGHGPSAHIQALAAHEYFVRSGRDWSPWGCRWAAR